MFISLEGCEGSGKTEATKYLKDELEKRTGQKVLITREIGGTIFAEEIRAAMMSNTTYPLSELFMVAAARVDHVTKVILPAILENNIVICDRYYHSTIAYQGYAMGLPIEFVNEIAIVSTCGIIPDVTLFMDVMPILSLKRKKIENKMDGLPIDFHQKVYYGYDTMRRKDNRMKRIDATMPLKEVHKAIISTIMNELEKEKRK